jgi:hypothetical protein
MWTLDQRDPQKIKGLVLTHNYDSRNNQRICQRTYPGASVLSYTCQFLEKFQRPGTGGYCNFSRNTELEVV